MYTDDKNAQVVLALLKKYGIRKIVISPGTTNVPIARSVEQDDFFEIYSMVDERGAAYFAGLATGYWRDKNEIKVNADIDKIFKPKITEEERAVKLAGWKKAIGRSFDWAEE